MPSVSILATVKSKLVPYAASGEELSYSDIYMDVILSEEAVYAGSVTEFPIEGNASASDHIYNSPEQVSISGVISNAPIIIQEGESREITTENRASSIKTILKNFQRNKVLVKLVSGLDVFSNMAIESITFGRSGPMDGIEVSMRLKNIFKVSAQLSSLTRASSSEQTGVNDLSNRTASDASDSQLENMSTLRRYFEEGVR